MAEPESEESKQPKREPEAVKEPKESSVAEPESEESKQPKQNKTKSGKGKGKSKGKRADRRAARRKSGKRKDKDKKHRGKAGTTDDEFKKFLKDMTRGKCLAIAMTVLGGLMIEFSQKHNAKYGLKDMYRMLLAMCGGHKGAASADGQYRIDRLLDTLHLPSPSWLWKRVRTVPHEYLVIRCQEMIHRSALLCRRRGMLRKPLDIAIDMHDIPLYAKVLNLTYAVFSKSKSGTTKFHRHATLCSVMNGHRLTLGSILVKRTDDPVDVVRALLELCTRHDIKIASLTMDRGFYSTDIIKLIQEMGIRTVMPAVKHSRLKAVLKEYEDGKRPAVSTHTISNGKDSVTYKLIILELKEKDDHSAEMDRLHGKPISDKYYVFMTTMPDSWIGDDPQRIAEFYKIRWGIENSYKSYEQLRPRTTSTHHEPRILLLFIPFVLCNLWILARFMVARSGLEYDREISLAMFIALFQSIIIEDALCPDSKPPPP